MSDDTTPVLVGVAQVSQRQADFREAAEPLVLAARESVPANSDECGRKQAKRKKLV